MAGWEVENGSFISNAIFTRQQLERNEGGRVGGGKRDGILPATTPNRPSAFEETHVACARGTRALTGSPPEANEMLGMS